jgi:hypothetical protein
VKLTLVVKRRRVYHKITKRNGFRLIKLLEIGALVVKKKRVDHQNTKRKGIFLVYFVGFGDLVVKKKEESTTKTRKEKAYLNKNILQLKKPFEFLFKFRRRGGEKLFKPGLKF